MLLANAIACSGTNPSNGPTTMHWIATFASHRVEIVPEVFEVAEFGQVAIVRGRAAGRLVPHAGGNSLDVDTWFMQVYRKRSDGTWHFWRSGKSAAR